ncbi:MAG: UbiH/UbiF family hydroxylase [Bradyrhizobiaceae bacterium]|nr:MAG: UbiH/UbiF family hydroxylase [Bradyrhizobiaceae bacterium]
MNQNDTTKFDVAIVGGGPVGLATAIAMAQGGLSAALVARKVPYGDNRTTALLGGSIDFLTALDVWRRCAAHAAPLQVMRLVDDTGRLIRAPEVRFSAEEIGAEAFGFNIENRILMTALEERAAELDHLVRYDDEAAEIAADDDIVRIRTAGGQTFAAALVAGADGKHSLSRKAAGISVKRRVLDQSAVTFNVSHTRPHRNISTEFHTSHGPCVFVPLPGDRSSVVWVTTPDNAARLAGLSDEALGTAAERQSHSILGRMRAEASRHVFPLSIETPAALAARRIALVGEAAHVVPPIGAQGLNIGLRDAADIAAIVTRARETGEDIGEEQILVRYVADRRADVFSRTFVIDMANRSLLSNLFPVQALRALGMHLIESAGPVRRLAMREGLSPSWRSRALPEGSDAKSG